MKVVIGNKKADRQTVYKRAAFVCHLIRCLFDAQGRSSVAPVLPRPSCSCSRGGGGGGGDGDIATGAHAECGD
eukprot:45383-Chlamydomonas_euryale.AAC.2